MIAFVEGLVVAVRDSSAVIAVGGVGLEISCPRPSLERCKVGQPMRLETSLIVREDGWSLYGFHESDALDVFKLLIGVSGVGPRTALAALSTYNPNVLASAIMKEDAKLLASVSGVGKKTAERIILELSNKLPAHLAVGKGAPRPAPSENEAFRDAVEALIALGYRDAQVRTVVANLLESGADSSAEGLIRKALAKLR
jgi:holliday junction DNA helicase RuvA